MQLICRRFNEFLEQVHDALDGRMLSALDGESYLMEFPLIPSASFSVVCFLFQQVSYDNTVRDGEGCVHQFLYGEDGVDTTRTK